MKSRAVFAHGASGFIPAGGQSRHDSRGTHRSAGFTLLEMCMVLFIIALMGGAMLPAIESAFTEQGLRNDSREVALMVKTAMLKSTEQHRAYAIDASTDSVSLHPATDSSEDATPTQGTLDTTAATAAPPVVQDDVTATTKFDGANKLLAPDPNHVDKWIPMPTTTWLFEPGEICPAPRVRMERGDAWVEMSFEALTGDVLGETAYFP